MSPTLTVSDSHAPAVLALQTDRLSQNGTNVSQEVYKTLDVASQVPVICIADDNSRAAVDVDMCGSLKVGGGGRRY